MKRLSILVLLSILYHQTSFSLESELECNISTSDESRQNESNTLNQTIALGFPVIVIETVDHEIPTVEYVDTPEGCFGHGTDNATKVPGKISRYEQDGTCTYSSGDYIKKTSGMTIKIRGNSSAYRAQKPYKIKLQKKADLLNRKDDNLRDKNWALIADFGWREWIGLKVAKIIQRKWAPECEWVNVIFNGAYHGLYLLTETIEQNDEARISIGNNGYIVEKDPYWWTESDEYIQSVFHPEFNYTMKYPDFTDLNETQKSIIQNDLDNLLSITTGNDYERYIGIDSWIDFVLTHDFLGTHDWAGCNVYYIKHDDTAKIELGPAWDFDLAGNADIFSYTHRAEQNLRNLFNNGNTKFIEKYVQRYDEVVESVNSMIYLMIQNGPSSEDVLNRNIEATNEVVTNYIWTHEEAKKELGNWFENHKVRLSDEIDKFRRTVLREEVSLSPNPQFYCRNNLIEIIGLKSDDIGLLFSIDGTLICSQKADASGRINICVEKHGIYILSFNGQNYKVAV